MTARIESGAGRVSPAAVTGCWEDARLLEAYELVDAVRREMHDAGIFVAANFLKRAATAIENADIQIEHEPHISDRLLAAARARIQGGDSALGIEEAGE